MQEQPPLHALRVAIERGETGCLVVHRPAWGSAEIFLSEGQIRGAQTPADGARMLQRLQARGVLQSSPLDTAIRAGGSVDVLAGQVPDTVLQEVKLDCFFQVLLDALFEPATHRFDASVQVRPQYVQVGHDSLELIDGLAKFYARIESWRDVAYIGVRQIPDTVSLSAEGKVVLGLCQNNGALVDVLRQSPWFEGRTLATIGELAQVGAVIAQPLAPGFSDHGSRDRGMGSGQYTSPIRDKISLESSGPALRVDAPRIDDAELARKLSVANDVMRTMVRAMDASNQDGQAQLQMVMEAAPIHLRCLYEGVQIERDGRLDAGTITHNLRRRLPSEQRTLLQQGLSDLLDRALSRCMEALPEEPADALLGRVVGYQKRLGR